MFAVLPFNTVIVQSLVCGSLVRHEVVMYVWVLVNFRVERADQVVFLFIVFPYLGLLVIVYLQVLILAQDEVSYSAVVVVVSGISVNAVVVAVKVGHASVVRVKAFGKLGFGSVAAQGRVGRVFVFDHRRAVVRRGVVLHFGEWKRREQLAFGFESAEIEGERLDFLFGIQKYCFV